jgi:hypothetical protein
MSRFVDKNSFGQKSDLRPRDVLLLPSGADNGLASGMANMPIHPATGSELRGLLCSLLNKQLNCFVLDDKQCPINDRPYSDACVFFIQCLLYSVSRREGSIKQKCDLEHLALSVLHSIGITCEDLGRILMLKGTNITDSQEKGRLDIKLFAAMLGCEEGVGHTEPTMDDKQATKKENDAIALSILHSVGRWLFDMMQYFCEGWKMTHTRHLPSAMI